MMKTLALFLCLATPAFAQSRVDVARGIITDGTLNGTTEIAGSLKMPAATTGAGIQTFTNSPCAGLTTAKWVPVLIAGQTGTWYIPLCQ